MAEEDTSPRKAASKPVKKKTRGRHGDGSLYKDKRSGLWTISVSLPPVKWRADGTPVRNRKTQQFPRRVDAQAALRELNKQKEALGGALPTASLSVDAWFTKWLKQHVVPYQVPRTAKTYEQYTRDYIVPALGGTTKLNKLTPDSLRNIEKLILGRGLSPSTAKNAFHYASAALDVAVTEGLLVANPAKRVKSPKRAKPDLDVFTLDDAMTLLRHIATHPDKALWATYLLTGARRGEIVGLEVDRVGDVLDLSWQLQRLQFTHGCGGMCGKKRAGNCPNRVLEKPHDFELREVSGGLYLTRPKSKSGWRLIPLVEPLRSILHAHVAAMDKNPWGLLFAGRHARYGGMIPPDPDRITHEWPKLRDEVFGPGRNVRLHDVRHTTVDLLYLAGIPEHLISEIVGHSTRSMTRQYKSRSDLEMLTAAMESLSGLVAPQQKKEPLVIEQ